MAFLIIGLVLGALFMMIKNNNNQPEETFAVDLITDVMASEVDSLIGLKVEPEHANLIYNYLSENVMDFHNVVQIVKNDSVKRYGPRLTREQLLSAATTGMTVLWPAILLGFNKDRTLLDAFNIVIEIKTREMNAA